MCEQFRQNASTTAILPVAHALQNFTLLHQSLPHSDSSSARIIVGERRSAEVKREEAIMVETRAKQGTVSERHRGPNLLVLTLIYLGFLVAGGSRLSAAFATPQDSVEKAVAYMASYGWTIQLGSFFELASAIPLGIFIATTISRLRFLGVRSAGESIAFFGGIGAAVMMVLASLTSWSLTRPGIPEAAGATAALRAVSFAAAGPGFAVLLGLFVAGVSIAAGLHKKLPRWLMWLGIVVAVACELAAFTILNFEAGYFIPVGRFVSIVWMIGVSLTLPASISDSVKGATVKQAA
jgi:hypothetical protein